MVIFGEWIFTNYLTHVQADCVCSIEIIYNGWRNNKTSTVTTSSESWLGHLLIRNLTRPCYGTILYCTSVGIGKLEFVWLEWAYQSEAKLCINECLNLPNAVLKCVSQMRFLSTIKLTSVHHCTNMILSLRVSSLYIRQKFGFRVV